MAVLFSLVLSPVFAYADNNKQNRGEKNQSHKTEQKAHQQEKKEEHSIKKMEHENHEDDDCDEQEELDERHDSEEGDHSCGLNPTPTPTPVDVAAPVLSLIAASSTTDRSTIISWATNEIAAGKVYFSTTTPVVLGTATNTGTTTASLLHSFSVASLTANTVYYYVVQSVDAVGNIATSTEQSFTTLQAPDTTAPIISNIVTSNVASTTATVSWATSELATSHLSYGTSTATTVLNGTSTPSLTHSFNLVGLIANKTYNLFLQSMDAIGNIAVATATLFTTN